jgi:hypothetical protein
MAANHTAINFHIEGGNMPPSFLGESGEIDTRASDKRFREDAGAGMLVRSDL